MKSNKRSLSIKFKLDSYSTCVYKLVESFSGKIKFYYDYLYLYCFSFLNLKELCFHLSSVCQFKKKKKNETQGKYVSLVGCRMNRKLASSAAISSYLSLLAPIIGYVGHLTYFWKKSGYHCSDHFSKLFKVLHAIPLSNN